MSLTPSSSYFSPLTNFFKNTTQGFVAFIIFFITAFIFYSEQIPNEFPISSPSNNSQFDLIVVLAGGQGRIEAGFDWLAKRPQSELYISGTDPKFKVQDLEPYLSEYKVSADRIHIDRESRNTRENALVLVEFLASKKNEPLKILLITSRYHMKRSLMIFNRFLPENVTFQAFPVESSNYIVDSYYKNLITFKIAFVEFIKFFWAYFAV